jgi:hypothetical protein
MFEREPCASDDLTSVGTGQAARTRRNRIWIAAFLCLTVPVLGSLALGIGLRPAQTPTRTPVTLPASNTNFPVVINRPAGPPKVHTGLRDFQGQPVMASCSSCHATTAPNVDTRSTEDLDQFHQGLTYTHGNLSCLSCHNSTDYDSLRLADTRAVDFSESMTLCSQCHGPQRRDYDRGLHGGMNGYWDLTRGGRTRNTCIDCHDPHAPAFPAVLPVLCPRDRISVRVKHPPAASTTPWHP